jgi:hypothetical protein
VDGTPLPGVRVSRAYRLTGEGLQVEERLDSERPLPRLVYRVPAGARDLQVDGEPSAKTRVELRGVTRLELRYRLP